MSAVLTIVGSSARAAAQSAARSGFVVHAADLFADTDLQAIAATARQVPDYPSGLGRLIAANQPGGWMYTGALENYPALIEEWQSTRTLFGNSADVLRRVRDPFLVSHTLTRAGLRSPAVRAQADGLPRDGSWLAKPFQSAGGLGIRAYTDSWSAPAQGQEAVYFQQRVEGRPVAAVFIANRDQVQLVGVTEQLCGPIWGGRDYQYCGSIGPIALSAAITQQFQQIGELLHAHFAVQGLFGVDAILNATGIWPVELNPRYTASVEVLERACRFNAVEQHVAACQQNPLRTLPAPERTSGKLIAYSAGRSWFLGIEALGRFACQRDVQPVVADIPERNSLIDAGWPIATVLADLTTPEAVRKLLVHRADALRICCAPA